jgi:UDP-N-acetylglucosamine acyltransferase
MLSGMEGVKFRRPVLPGDQLRVEVTLLRRHRPLWKVRGTATVDGQVVAQADLSLVEVEASAVTDRGETEMESQAAVRIHPTAIVAPGAQLDTGVEIGAYAVIGRHVRIGRGTRVMTHATVDGRTTLGAENEIYPYTSLGSTPQDLKYGGEESRLVLGDRNRVREFASLSLGTEGGGMETRIGDDNLFMNYSHVGHDCRIANRVVLANSTALAGHVQIDDSAIVSGLAGVAQFVRIGESGFIGGGSMVVMDVPPYCMANGDRAALKGLNLVGLERRGLGLEEVKALKRAYRILFQSKLVVRDAVDRVRREITDSPRAIQLAEFVAASERGVTRP